MMKFQKDIMTREELLNCAVLVKYSLIPLYLFGGLLAIVLFFMTFIPVPFMIFAAPMGIVFLNVYGYIFLLGSMPFSMFYLTKVKQEKVNNNIIIMIARIMQFFLCFDVIAIMILSFKENKWRKLTLTIIGIVITIINAL